MEPTLRAFTRFRDAALVGSFMVGLSTFQAEFDFGVPQFRMVWQPLLLALAREGRPSRLATTRAQPSRPGT